MINTVNMTTEISKITLDKCKELMVKAFLEFEEAKEDLEIKLDSAWEAFEGDIEAKSIGLEQKHVKDYAKKVAKDKIDAARNANSIFEFLDKGVGRTVGEE